MGNDESALTRRYWLVTGGIALGGLALPGASGGAETIVHPARARLSLNENPFGPSPFALAAIRPGPEWLRVAIERVFVDTIPAHTRACSRF